MAGKRTLAVIKGEKLLRAEMNSRCDMQNVECPVPLGRGVLKRIGACQTQHGIRIAGHQDIHTGGDIRLPVRKHLVRFPRGISFRPVLGMKPDLQPDGLDELKFQQTREIQGLIHGSAMGQGRRSVKLLAVNRAEEAGIRIRDHGSPVSKARISSTSACVKTRSPQIRSKRDL